MRTSTIMVMTALFALTACQGRDVNDVAKIAEKELGIPVTINTTAADTCAKYELDKFLFQYKQYSKSERALIKRALSAKYKAIIVNESVSVGRVEGATYLMTFGYRGPCENMPWEHDPMVCKDRQIQLQKQVGDTRKTIGKEPVLRVEKSDSLVIQAEEAGYAAVAYTAFTGNRDLYESINTLADLEAAARRGYHDFEVARDTTPPELCAPTIPLRDLL